MAAGLDAPILEVGEGLEGVKSPLPMAHHVPGYIYTSPEVFELEKQEIFLKDWLCVGRVEEIGKPGDYATFRLAGEPLVVARDEQGDINAFANVCRHRGVEVAQGQGNLKEFSCPYHGWTYNLKGELLGAPFIKGVKGFDPKTCRLKPVKVDSWGGFLFVNFDTECESRTDFFGDLLAQTGDLKPERMRLWDKFVVNLECNWKLAPENLAGWYHLETLHATTLGHYTPAERVSFGLFERGSYTVSYLSGPLAPGGESLFGRIPWLAGRDDTYAFSFYLRPNMNFFTRIDQFLFMIAWPTGPETTEHHIYLMFPEGWFEQPKFAERAQAYSDWMKAFLQEDIDMVGSLQRGFKSQGFEPGPMVGLEKPIHHMINNYLDRMFGSG